MGNAIVTGAASGIGRGVREKLEMNGDRVIGIDLHDVEVDADLQSDATAYVHGSILWADGGMDAAIRPDAF